MSVSVSTKINMKKKRKHEYECGGIIMNAMNAKSLLRTMYCVHIHVDGMLKRMPRCASICVHPYGQGFKPASRFQ